MLWNFLFLCIRNPYCNRVRLKLKVVGEMTEWHSLYLEGPKFESWLIFGLLHHDRVLSIYQSHSINKRHFQHCHFLIALLQVGYRQFSGAKSENTCTRCSGGPNVCSRIYSGVCDWWTAFSRGEKGITMLTDCELTKFCETLNFLVQLSSKSMSWNVNRNVCNWC